MSVLLLCVKVGEKMAEKGLTNKQKRFCEEYIKDCNGKQAAIRAGYSPKTAYSIANENLNKPELQNYIKNLMNELKDDCVADAKETMEFWTALMRGEIKEQVLKYDGFGKQSVVEVNSRVSDRAKGSDMIAKHLGMYKTNLGLEAEDIIININGEDELKD